MGGTDHLCDRRPQTRTRPQIWRAGTATQAPGLYKLARASEVAAIIDAAAVPYLDAARESLRAGFLPGGTRRNLAWVRPHLDPHVDDQELLLLADAQTSGGLLVAGELPGHPVIGELVPRRRAAATLTVR